jgi:predicted nucleotidyltransferase
MTVLNAHYSQMASLDGGADRLRLIRRWPSDQAETWIRSYIDFLATNPNFLALVAYGSAVRHVEMSSDVDLLVIMSGREAEMPTPPMEIDLKVMFAGDVDEYLQKSNDILIWCLRLGELLMERDRYWTNLKVRLQDKLPFPLASAAEARARKAEVLWRDLLSHGDPEAAEEQFLTNLTQLARAKLLRARVFPASRPELANQLDSIGERHLAEMLRRHLIERSNL